MLRYTSSIVAVLASSTFHAVGATRLAMRHSPVLLLSKLRNRVGSELRFGATGCLEVRLCKLLAKSGRHGGPLAHPSFRVLYGRTMVMGLMFWMTMVKYQVAHNNIIIIRSMIGL